MGYYFQLGIFILVIAFLIYDSFMKWRSTKKILHLIAIGFFIMAAISVFFFSRSDTYFLIIGGIVLRMIAHYTRNEKLDKIDEDKDDEVNRQ